MISCIAIDDNALALQQIGAYIQKTSFLKLMMSFKNTMEAMQYLNNHSIDVVFTDIKMSKHDDLQMITAIENPPSFVITSAGSIQNTEQHSLNALDYLKKPIALGDFLATTKTIKEHFKSINSQQNLSSNHEYLFIKSEYKLVRIRLSEVMYIESLGSYLQFHLENGENIMTLSSMKKVEKKLEGSLFMRISRSITVNLNKITIIERGRIIFGDTHLAISETYKRQFQAYIDSNFL